MHMHMHTAGIEGVCAQVEQAATDPRTGEALTKLRLVITTAHEDIIADDFWTRNPRAYPCAPLDQLIPF